MPVLIEAINVVVRRNTIEQKYPGGWEGYLADCPNRTLCADEYVARVGFMAPPDVKAFTNRLEKIGFIYLKDGMTVEIATVDQIYGFTVPCDWLLRGKVDYKNYGECKACWLKGSPTKDFITPFGWKYEGSLTEQYIYTPTKNIHRTLKFLRRENKLDVYLNLVTNKEIYVGRPFKDQL